MFRHILETPVTERAFLEQLHELNHKINFVKQHSYNDTAACRDVLDVVEKLKYKVNFWNISLLSCSLVDFYSKQLGFFDVIDFLYHAASSCFQCQWWVSLNISLYENVWRNSGIAQFQLLNKKFPIWCWQCAFHGCVLKNTDVPNRLIILNQAVYLLWESSSTKGLQTEPKKIWPIFAW